jgi:hypothetical protein
MLDTEKIGFLLECDLVEAALKEADSIYLTQEKKDKVKLLIKHKPEPKTPEYGTWFAATQKFLKTI